MIEKVTTSRDAAKVLNEFKYLGRSDWKDIDTDVESTTWRGDHDVIVPTFAAIAIANELNGYIEQQTNQLLALFEVSGKLLDAILFLLKIAKPSIADTARIVEIAKMVKAYSADGRLFTNADAKGLK